MPSTRRRGNGGKGSHERRAAKAASRPPMPPPGAEQLVLSKQTIGAVNHLVAATGMSPSQALDELVSCGVISARALHTQLFLGGILSTPLQAAVPPEEAQTSAPDPDDVDTRSAEEKLAALRDLAHPEGCRCSEHWIAEDAAAAIAANHEAAEPTMALGTSEDESRETPVDGTPRISIEDDGNLPD